MIGQLALEILKFESVDDDGRRTTGHWYSIKYTLLASGLIEKSSECHNHTWHQAEEEKDSN